MTTSADVIAAINQRRTRLTLRPETPGMLPTGWQDWLDAMPRVDGHSQGSLAPSLVAAFVQRPLRPIPRTPPPMGRWQSISRLLQQQWEPDLRDERKMRIAVGAVDILLHMILIILLLWLMYLRLMVPPPQTDDEQAVQVEFIGRGNAAEGGGALANAGAESAAAAAASTTRASTPTPAAGRPDASISPVPVAQQSQASSSSEAPRQAPELPMPVAVEAAQPLQVSEVRTPELQSFQLPPPKLREVQLPQVQLREAQPKQQVEAIVSLQPQPVRMIKPREVQVELRMPKLQQQVQAIEVPEPQRLATLPARVLPTQPTRSVEVPQLRGEVRDIQMPPGGVPTPSVASGNGVAQQPSPAAGAGGTRGSAPAAGSTPAGNGQGAQPAVQGGRGVASTGTGAGSGNKPAPGGWPGTAKTDDWGASTRNVAGAGNGSGKGNGRKGDGKPGLFNADGSPRLSDEWTKQSGINVDRAGTWLKRPGLEYRSTRFDRYWIPGGTLLEEWVRKGIKQVSIPIPGTGKSLQCVISLLQLGGGCMPVDPDVNEQPARARPPPDIPFKPGLQEDNGSVKP
ncbi:MAG: hypothetical protein ABIO61_05920 [Thermomonas sp.]